MELKDDSITPYAGTPPNPSRIDEPQKDTSSQQEAVANVVRSQIASLYNNSQPGGGTTSQATENSNPYNRSHAANPQPDTDQWKKYHTAWQSYYQKYYEGYYAHHYKNASSASSTQPAYSHYFSNQPDEEVSEEQVTKDEALFDLRQKLLERVQESAKKVRKSRHFVPITSAVLVMLVFLFLQFNRTIFANVVAYVSPGSIDPQNIVIDPSSDIIVDAEPRLIIPKINVDVPVIYDVGNDYKSQMKAMEKGVAHFAIPGASSHPGQIGNTVLSGHSSNDLFDSGDYKFIFAQLEKLAVGDSIYANYKSKRYTYTITKKEVVKPTQVDKLVHSTNKPVLTLITCTPLGTALNRLLVTAEQISPDPTKSVAAPTESTNAESEPIPGNSPTLLERIFGNWYS